jgi:hypothetical protein
MASKTNLQWIDLFFFSLLSHSVWPHLGEREWKGKEKMMEEGRKGEGKIPPLLCLDIEEKGEEFAFL